MKKFILASAFALLATPALFAQSDNNTYNMQIELKNGTKITLGPNDLKNITFNEGAIQIEGNTIDELNAAINDKALELKASIAYLQKSIDYNSEKIAMLQQQIKENEKFRRDYAAMNLHDRDITRAAKQEGLRQGLLQGLSQGAEQKAVEAAKNLLKMELLSIEQIAMVEGLPLETVRDLQQQIQ